MEELTIKKKYIKKPHNFGAGGVHKIGNIHPAVYAYYYKLHPEWFNKKTKKNDEIEAGAK